MVLVPRKTDATRSSRNRRRHSTSDRECRRSSPEPCRAERVTRSDNHEELGVGRTDRRPRDGGPVYTSRVLHRGSRPSYCASAQRREDVHPRLHSRWHRNVRKGTKSRVGHRLVARADRPRQLPEASRPAIETGSVRIAQILWPEGTNL